MRTVILTVGLVVVTGCGKKDKDEGGGGGGGWSTTEKRKEDSKPGKIEPPSAGISDPGSKLPQTLKQRHNGKNAAEWGAALLDSAENVSQSAAFALRAIGPEGLRFILEGFASSVTHVREKSIMTALDPSLAVKYPEVFSLALINLLSDEDGGVRGGAARMLENCRFTSGLEPIKKALVTEKNAYAKRLMNEAVATLSTKK